MTDDPKITQLRPIVTASLGMAPDSFASMIHKFIEEQNLIDLEGDYQNDVELIPQQPGERRLGALNPFEISMFTFAMLSQEIIHDVMIEAQAQIADQHAQALRQQRFQQTPAQQEISPLTDTDRIYVNQLSLLNHVCRSNYEFSIRVRLNEFDHAIMVRTGMMAYTVDG